MVISYPLLAIILLLYQHLALGHIEKSCNLNLQIISRNKSYDLTRYGWVHYIQIWRILYDK